MYLWKTNNLSTPVFRVFIEIRGFLSFLKSVGLSNRFSNKLFLCLFCSVAMINLAMSGFPCSRRYACSPELFSGFFCVTSAHCWKKSVSTVSAQSAALLVVAMGVQICYHTGLRVAGILLHHGGRLLSHRSQRWGTPPPTPGNTPICSERVR